MISSQGRSAETPPRWMIPCMPATARSTAVGSVRSAATKSSSAARSAGLTRSLRRRTGYTPFSSRRSRVPMPPAAPVMRQRSIARLLTGFGGCGKDLLGEMEGRVGGRHAAIDGGLQQHFLDLVLGHATLDRRAQVQLELLVAAEGHHHRQHEQSPRTLVEPRARPDLAPGVAGDQVLEVLVEIVAPGERTVDIAVAQHAAPFAQAAIVAFGIIHAMPHGNARVES